jgi:hypothetical protein
MRSPPSAGARFRPIWRAAPVFAGMRLPLQRSLGLQFGPAVSGEYDNANRQRLFADVFHKIQAAKPQTVEPKVRDDHRRWKVRQQTLRLFQFLGTIDLISMFGEVFPIGIPQLVGGGDDLYRVSHASTVARRTPKPVPSQPIDAKRPYE